MPGSRPAPVETARLTRIGAVCRTLEQEFPDISISKIRYLEDQGLLKLRRTRGGYRLFSEADVERLRTILHLQRDEFLPLRVIREELALPAAERRRRRGIGLQEPEQEVDEPTLCERAGISPELAAELAAHGLLAPRSEGGEARYSETDVEIAYACARILRHGIDARHLRAFRHAADRVSGLLEQLVMPSLRARNPERRRAALGELDALAEQAQELVRLLVRRELRGLFAPPAPTR
ncbi:MAG: transcriptional regulator FtsR [Gaiellaceae bacterium]